MRYATDQVFKPLDPMRPVDTAQAFAIERKHKPLKILGITFGAIVALLLIAYAGIALYFTDRFMPNSNIGDINVSLMSAGDAEKVLVDSIKDYALSIDGQGFSLKLTASDAGLSIDEGKVVRDMLSDMNPWAWPFELQKDHDETAKLVATYNGTGLEDAIRSAVAAFNEGAAQPVNATIGFDDAQASFVIKPEAVGTALDADRVLASVSAAVASLAPSATLGEDALQQPTLFADDTRLAKAADDANALLKADFNLKLADTAVARVNADQIADWMRLGDNVTVGVDEGLVAAWVQDIASACNTYQARRTFTRADGKEVTVSGGVYGWIVDKDQLQKTVMDGVRSAQTGDVAIPCEQEAGAYDGLHGRDWGKRYLDIDLAEQHARFYGDDGSLAWESDIVSGTPDGEHDTPEGVYVINGKESGSIDL